MKKQLKLPIAIICVIAAGALAAFGISHSMSVGSLDHGQVKYTPGVPPWMEKAPSKRGAPGLGSGAVGGTPAPGAGTQPSDSH